MVFNEVAAAFVIYSTAPDYGAISVILGAWVYVGLKFVDDGFEPETP